MESTTRKFMSVAVIILAAAAAACGGSTEALGGTAPSQVSSVAAASDNGGSLNLLKEGKGKGRPTPDIGTTPTEGTIPDPEDAEDDAGDFGKGHGHGKAAIQIEGFSKSITGGCPDGLTIVLDDDTTVTTVNTEDLTTEFQRATCQALLAAGETPVHLHIAATSQDETLVAIYVRMQGPKGDDDGDEEEDTTPTTTAPTTGTTLK